MFQQNYIPCVKKQTHKVKQFKSNVGTGTTSMNTVMDKPYKSAYVEKDNTSLRPHLHSFTRSA